MQAGSPAEVNGEASALPNDTHGDGNNEPNTVVSPPRSDILERIHAGGGIQVSIFVILLGT